MFMTGLKDTMKGHLYLFNTVCSVKMIKQLNYQSPENHGQEF